MGVPLSEETVSSEEREALRIRAVAGDSHALNDLVASLIEDIHRQRTPRCCGQ